MRIVGIDPGLFGALTLLTPGRVVAWRLPVIRSNAKNRCELDSVRCRTLVADVSMLEPALCVIEQVGGLPGQGAASAFSFGRTCGRLAEMCESAGWHVEYVAPVVWRAKLGVRARAARDGVDTKESSRRVASDLWPADAHQWIKKTDDGCAEAALLAEYGRRFLL